MPTHKVIVECYPDETLVCTLMGIEPRRVLHATGHGQVVNYLLKGRAPVALKDEEGPDNTPRALDAFERTADGNNSGEWLFEREGMRLIVLRPRLEEWVLARAAESGVDPAGFGLPRDAESLHDAISKSNRHKQGQFREFVLALVDRGNHGIARVKSWLS